MNITDQKSILETEGDYWNIRIVPHGNILDLNLADVWNYRDLFWLFIKRDFISFYKQTVLGPIWFFIQPVFTTIVYTFIFGNLAGLSTDGLPKPLFYIAGIAWWNYFADCLNKTSTVFRDNSHIFGKVYFPRLIMPLSIVCSNLIKFGIQLGVLFLLTGWYVLKGYQFHLNAIALLFPILILLLALVGLGLGLLVSALTTKYRDLIYLVTFGTQLLMYTTTVVYPLSAVPLKYKNFVAYNPLTPIIETFRYGFTGIGTFSWASLGISALIICLITIAGVIVFNKVERNYIDTV
ncbi:ABC transporter permease [Mucilaginibacter ginkgonis]|uniref:Transport permease protein n=1 Tax=Mucilaginibacter ginkgonis TaxID=2682091 RepID=A0A6I4IMR9_9SPHI|nr:ABC transporter permease [Mucilaginibacter ginkgonis]QQL50193.1 ABC transporter permease [Mucilaginibacter ginkgonis]